jgi:multidrug efflux pump subunit AcrB
MVAIVSVALRRPYRFLVLAMVVLVCGGLSGARAPAGIFPNGGNRVASGHDRAVTGGAICANIATLFFVPAIFSLVQRQRGAAPRRLPLVAAPVVAAHP